MVHRIFPITGIFPIDGGDIVNVGGPYQTSVMESELPSTLRYLARRQSGVVSRIYHRDVERAHGLPESARQVPFTTPGGRRGRRDRVYEPFGLVIELDGRLAHQPEERWRDKTRDNAAAADGKQTLRYGWSQVKWEPCETAAEVARALRRRGWGGRPRPCSPGCPVQRAAG